MKRQRFYGASDDLIELDGDLLYEEYPADAKNGAEFLIEAEGGGLRVKVEYGSDGTWFVGVAPVDDDVPFPTDTKVNLDVDKYTAVLLLVLPDDATITQTRGRKPDGEPLEPSDD